MDRRNYQKTIGLDNRKAMIDNIKRIFKVNNIHDDLKLNN